MRVFSPLLHLSLAASLIAVPALHGQQASAAPAAASPAGTLQSDLARDIEGLERKYMGLVEAMSQEQLGYRPAAGVRSASEVFMHVAGANYMLAGFFGVKAPAEVSQQSMSEKVTAKAEVTGALRGAFSFGKQAIANVPNSELDKQIKLFGRDATVRMAMLLYVTHMHEHLGQLIAYARANGVTPPWSGGGN